MNTSSFVEGSVVKGEYYAMTLFLVTIVLMNVFVLRLLQRDAPIYTSRNPERGRWPSHKNSLDAFVFLHL